MTLPRSGRAPWPAILVLLVLGGGIALAVTQWRASTSATEAFSDPEADPLVREGIVEQALGLTGDSTIKSLWLDEVHGVDLSHLSEPRRRLFVRMANAQRCTCGCGYTLAGCRAYDPSCDVSLPRVEALLDSVQRGLVRDASGLWSGPSHGG